MIYYKINNLKINIKLKINNKIIFKIYKILVNNKTNNIFKTLKIKMTK